MFIPPMFISLRSRTPLIMVVFRMSCPATFVLIVILKSPRIGPSVSGLRWADEMAVANTIAQAMTANRSNLLFMKRSLCILFRANRVNVSNLSKSEALLKKLFLPPIQKHDQVFLHHPPRGFKLALAAAVQQLSIAAQDGDGRHALFQRDLVLLRQIEILVHLADIDVHQHKTFAHNLSGSAIVQRAVEHVTVVTPVRAEHEQHALMIRRS